MLKAIKLDVEDEYEQACIEAYLSSIAMVNATFSIAEDGPETAIEKINTIVCDLLHVKELLKKSIKDGSAHKIENFKEKADEICIKVFKKEI